MKFEYTDGHNKDFIELCHGLDEFLNELVGGEENRAEYIQYNKLDDIHDVVIAYDKEYRMSLWKCLNNGHVKKDLSILF